MKGNDRSCGMPTSPLPLADRIFRTVMAGLVPAIHVFLLSSRGNEDVDARDKPGHDEFGGTPIASSFQMR